MRSSQGGSAARLLWLMISLLLFLAPLLFFPLIPVYGLFVFDWPRWTLLTLVARCRRYRGSYVRFAGHDADFRDETDRIPRAHLLQPVSITLHSAHSRDETALASADGPRRSTLADRRVRGDPPLATLAHRSIEMPAIAIGSRAARWLGRYTPIERARKVAERLGVRRAKCEGVFGL